MNRASKLIFPFLILIVLHSCNTMVSVSTTKLEIVVPGKIKIPSKFKRLAIRYNNVNVAYNHNFSKYTEDGKILNDSINLDSMAAELYFRFFIDHSNYQNFFDTIIEIEKGEYSDVRLNDSLFFSGNKNVPDYKSPFLDDVNLDVYNFAKFVNSKIDTNQYISKSKLIDPKLGLYTKKELNEIADSTNAGLLMSLDYFASNDGIITPDYLNNKAKNNENSVYIPRIATEKVYTLAGWSFYDLHEKELLLLYKSLDSISWREHVYNLKQAMSILPPRKEAVLASAEMEGEKFAEYLIPHWIEVHRMYYKSGHIELSKTEELIEQNRWLEAAEIWKKNVTNKNKSIAAKSMFNLALACELNGDLEAAMDWAVKSFHVFGSKNAIHAANCQSYINILARRKNDIEQIESMD